MFLPLVLAIEVEVKDSFNKEETFMAKISGNFYEAISAESIVFYRGHVRTPITPSVTKINSGFYIYAQLSDKIPGNYSISIEDSRYFENNQIVEKNIVRNFTINKETADFSIDKGFIVTNEDFFIEVKNNLDTEITVSTSTDISETSSGGFFESFFGLGTSSNSSILKVGESKKINFIANNELNKITFSSENTTYEIPVYISSIQEKEQQIEFRFEPNFLNTSMSTNSETKGIIYLRNTGEVEIENISLSISESLINNVVLPYNSIESIRKNSSKKIEFRILSDGEEKTVQGKITANHNNEDYAYLAVSLNFLKDFIPSYSDNRSVEAKTCSELDGKICSKNSTCSGDVNYTKDGVCCFDVCKVEEKTSIGRFIGWLMIISIIGFVIWFYLKKYKKVESVSDLMKVLKKS